MKTLILAAALVALPASAEVFVAAGATGARISATIANQVGDVKSTEAGAHVGFGVRRSLERGDIGVRLELDDVGELLLALRLLDYRYHLSDRFAVGAFIGAARLDLATPAFGNYLGGGVHFKQVLPSWDLSLELRWADEVARDNLLPSDPQGEMPDNFYDVAALSLQLTYRF
jgi:hypothetical protein